MQKLEIKGGKKISGTIVVSGSKNATLPILAATILTSKKVILKNIPIEVTGSIVNIELKNLEDNKIPLLRRKLGIIFQDFKLFEY